MTKNVRRESGDMSSSTTQKTKQQLFANLLKVQYPMSQDEPSAKPEQQQDLMHGYHAHMEALIDKYQDSY